MSLFNIVGCRENGAIELFGVASGSKLLNMTGNKCRAGDVNMTTPGMFTIPKRCADLTTVGHYFAFNSYKLVQF